MSFSNKLYLDQKTILNLIKNVPGKNVIGLITRLTLVCFGRAKKIVLKYIYDLLKFYFIFGEK